MRMQRKTPFHFFLHVTQRPAHLGDLGSYIVACLRVDNTEEIRPTEVCQNGIDAGKR